MDDAAKTYLCPMHPDVRQQGAGACWKCGMSLLPEGTRFGMLRHILSNPLHIAMAVAMLVLMALAMAMLMAR